MGVDQDMSVVIWIPRYLTEFTCDSSVSGLIKNRGGGIECKHFRVINIKLHLFAWRVNQLSDTQTEIAVMSDCNTT